MSIVWIDDCPAPEDLTYWLATRDDLTVCDSCEHECAFGWGDRDRARFCCVCVQRGAPASYKCWYCKICEKRQEER